MSKKANEAIGVEYEDEIGMSINLEDEIEKVTFNDPATIVFWKDGTKTVSKCHKGDTYNKETGLAMCIIRKLCNNRNYNKVFENPEIFFDADENSEDEITEDEPYIWDKDD